MPRRLDVIPRVRVWSADSKSVYAPQPVGKVVQLNIADRQLHTVLELKDFPEPFPPGLT